MREKTKVADFEGAVLPHLDAAYNLARWITRDPADADDVVQEAYLRAFRFFDDYRGGDSRAWILKIVRNACFTWIQKNRSVEAVEFDEELPDVETSEIETQLIENIDRQMLRKLVEELEVRFREVVILRDMEGLSYKEIAAVIDVPLGTVMSRLARARRKLEMRLKARAKGVSK